MVFFGVIPYQGTLQVGAFGKGGHVVLRLHHQRRDYERCWSSLTVTLYHLKAL